MIPPTVCKQQQQQQEVQQPPPACAGTLTGCLNLSGRCATTLMALALGAEKTKCCLKLGYTGLFPEGFEDTHGICDDTCFFPATLVGSADRVSLVMLSSQVLGHSICFFTNFFS
jgi:hypothetical protein